MAKRGSGPNRSAAIRDFAKDHPGAKPKAISEGLAKAGLKVSPGYVSTVLSSERRKGGKTGRRRKAATGRPAGNNAYANLVHAKRLVDQLGSVEKAKAALDTLSKLLG